MDQDQLSTQPSIMSSPDPDTVPSHDPLADNDDPMRGSGDEEEEGEGDAVMPGISDDSSEEGEDDEEEARRIRDGFIVSEEEEDSEEEAPRRKRRKRRKKHHREEETLEDDDLELLEENTGVAYKRPNRLTRLRRHDSDSPPAASSSKRRAVVESSEDDLDNDEDTHEVPDIRKIWDDDRRGEDDDEDMSDFIDYSEDEEGAAMNEEAREARRLEKKEEQSRRKRARARPELVGIDAIAWDEIHEVFGDGHEYDWALVGDDEADLEEDRYKPDMKYQDVFEPSEIKKRMLTEDDDLIRVQDIPERMQLATSTLSETSSLSTHIRLTEEDLGDAAMWVTTRLSHQKQKEYFGSDGSHQQLQGALVLAVTFALRQIFVEEYEVPYTWAHKQDYITHFDTNGGPSVHLLSLPELWQIYNLGQKYRSLLERRHVLTALYERLQVTDDYFTVEILPQIDSVELVADATEWLNMKYKNKRPDYISDFRFHDDDEPEAAKRRKMPSRVSAYELTKKSVVSKLAEGFGIKPHDIVLNLLAETHTHFVEDTELHPVAFAEQFSDPDPSKALAPEELLRRARMIISTELGKDPLLRNQIRKIFKENAHVSVEPTERGITKIDESHPYFNFKYLLQKPIDEMLTTPQFLLILAAESEHLVTVTISIPPAVKADFERRLSDAFASDNFSESAKAWNAERLLVVHETLEQHLIPAGVKWTREYVREEAEDFLASKCSERLRERVNVAPYATAREPRYGEGTASVLAISWGKGDPHKDAITLVYVDEAGRMREHTKIDNLHDQDNLDEFKDLVSRRKPDVAVVGGFSIVTLKLMNRVKEILGSPSDPNSGEQAWTQPTEEGFNIPAIYVFDDVARIYQHSKRAADEFSALSPTAKYCVGLARYVQSPLNEFAALGSDIAAISFDEESQNLIPKEKLLSAFEQVLVDVTNKVGVDINRAVTDPYYQHVLPFVCGLGPRKAQMLVKKIASQGGTIVNRDQFIKAGLLTTKIFLNAAGFLRVIQDRDNSRPGKYRPDDENAPDPLDDTRIHPEDYELARKMATDALELDEEDIHDEHPSQVVTSIMNDGDKERKLTELNLGEFATSLFQANQDQKRHTLDVIREELVMPFREKREKFLLPKDWDIVTMLSGETPKTLGVGLIVSALVYRTTPDSVGVRLDSGIEGFISTEFLPEMGRKPRDVMKKGQTITGIVIDLIFRLRQDEFLVSLSTRPGDLDGGDYLFRNVRPDQRYWDDTHYKKDQDMLARKKRAETDRTRRVIKHPNFHNFNTAQAEAYLEKQQRGDVVIRPSSKGINHLAVTWKVDERLYQHIDVTEMNADPTGQTIGGQLVVDANHIYSDLDELIVNHVQAMSRRVEELMAHEKFKHGSEDDLHIFLKNFLAANPSKSMYGFTLNRKKPGHFNLCFLANKNSTVQTWPIRVAPEAYYLFDAPAVGVPELCDAFKVRHLHESQNVAAAAAGGKTPYGAGARTPARIGGATPGHLSIRNPGRTPNPYGGAHTPFVPPHHTQGPPSNYMPPPPTSYAGYQTPSLRPPVYGQHPHPPMGGPPPNMNPPRPGSVWGGGGGWS